MSQQRLVTLLIPLPMLLIGLVLVGIGTVDLITQPQNSIPEPAENSSAEVEAGYEAFLSYCSTCHGMDGGGITGLGKNLVESEFVRTQTDADLHTFIITGRPIWDAANTTGVDMPPRGGNPMLSDQQIDQIIVYLRAREGEG